MIVLGLDPGSRHFGWGIVAREGTRLSHVDHGVVDVDTEGPFGGRLVEIETALVAVLERHRPSCASVESLFFAKDAQAAAKLGHARGVALLVCARAALPTYEYAPALVKRTVAGGGRADKGQVARMVRVFLKLSELPRADAADALAVALTHLQQLPIRLAESRASQIMAAAAARTSGRTTPARSAALALLCSTSVRGGHKRRGSTV